MKNRYKLRVYYCNPNGTNDIEVVDTKTLTTIATLEEALFGVKVDSEYEFIKPEYALKHVAVSPVSDGTETVEFLNKYFNSKR